MNNNIESLKKNYNRIISKLKNISSSKRETWTNKRRYTSI